MRIKRDINAVRGPGGERIRSFVLELAAVGMAATLLAPAAAYAEEAINAAPAAGSGVLSAGDPTLQAVTAAAGPFHIQFRHSGKCADVPAYSTASGKWLDQWTCVNQSNERWYLDPVGPIGGVYWYRIRSASSGLCMNVNGASLSNRAAIIQYRCGAYTNEYFAFWRGGDVPTGYYLVQAFQSGRCLKVDGGSVANGAKLIQYSCAYSPDEYVRLY